MIQIGPHKVFAGDCHTHWNWDRENPTLYIAGMDKLGLDFVLLCADRDAAEEADRMARAYGSGLRFFPSREVTNSYLHIVGMLRDDDDGARLTVALPDSPPDVEGAETEPAELLRRVKARCRLTLFAHPGRNWPAAYDGTSFRPLIELYRQGLYDGIQIQIEKSRDVLEAFRSEGIDVPLVAGIDCHGCLSLTDPPPYLYGPDTPVFSHISPCSRTTTLVFADELSPDAVARAIRAGRSCVFGFDTEEIIGPPDLVRVLSDGEYAAKRRRRIERHAAVSIDVGEGLVIGDPVRICVMGGTLGEKEVEEEKNVRHPGNEGGLWEAKETRGSVVEMISMPAFLKRADFYFPLTVAAGDDRFAYGVRARQPVGVAVFERVEGPADARRYLVECDVLNTTAGAREVTLELTGPDLGVEEPEAKLVLQPHDELRHRFEVARPDRPGFEYAAQVRWRSGRAGLGRSMPLSFAVCRYLPAGEDPWRIDLDQCIHIDDSKQIIEHGGSWGGPEDLSLAVELRWDERTWYFFAEVRDDVFFQKWTGRETFWGDSVQIAFGVSRLRTRGYGSNYELCLAKTPEGDETFVWYTPQTGEEQVRRHMQGAALGVDRDAAAKRTRYRLAVPWEKLAPFEPEVGAQFQFALVHNDNDGPPGTWHVKGFWGGNISVKDMSLAHTVSLVR